MHTLTGVQKTTTGAEVIGLRGPSIPYLTMLIKLKVKTKQQVSKLEFKENQYIAHVKSLPVNNKANIEIIGLVAKYFRVPKSKVSIKSGVNSNKKNLSIDTEAE